MSACKFSSKKLASKAGKTLVSKVGSALDKSLAGSVLSQSGGSNVMITHNGKTVTTSVQEIQAMNKILRGKKRTRKKTPKKTRSPKYYQLSLFSSFFDYGTQQKSF